MKPRALFLLPVRPKISHATSFMIKITYVILITPTLYATCSFFFLEEHGLNIISIFGYLGFVISKMLVPLLMHLSKLRSSNHVRLCMKVNFYVSNQVFFFGMLPH